MLSQIITTSWGHCLVGFFQENLLNTVRRHVINGRTLTQAEFKLLTENGAGHHTQSSILKGSGKFLRDLRFEEEKKDSKKDNKNEEKKSEDNKRQRKAAAKDERSEAVNSQVQ